MVARELPLDTYMQSESAPIAEEHTRAFVDLAAS